MKFPFWQMLRQFGGRSLYVRLMTGALVVIAISTTARVLFVTNVLSRDIRETESAHQLSSATYIAKDVGDRIALRREFLRQAAAQFPGGAERSPGQAGGWLGGNLSYRLLFPAGLALYDTAGTLIVRTADTAQAPSPLLAPAGSDPVTVQFFRSGPDDTPYMTMSAAIRDAAGHAVAVIAGTTGLLAENFLKPVYEQKIGETGGVLVIDPVENRIIVSSNRPQILVSAAAPGVNPLHDKARAGWRGIGETTAASGRRVLSAIVSIPGTGWFLVAHQPIAQAFLPAQRLTDNILLLALLYILIAAAVIYLGLSYLFGPLIEITRRLHAMARGEQPVDFLPPGRHDEIGQIAAGFNSLLTTLREKEKLLRENEALLEHMAHHDSLTGLPNLKLFHDRLTHSLGYAQRTGGGLALLYFDLDGFKPVNDGHGHAAGDTVLREVASRVSTLLRRNDTFARIGGDEFAIILADPVNARSQADAVAEKCRAAIAQPISIEGTLVSVGASIGIACFPGDGTSEAELLAKADAAMYRAKRATRAVEGLDPP